MKNQDKGYNKLCPRNASGERDEHTLLKVAIGGGKSAEVSLTVCSFHFIKTLICYCSCFSPQDDVAHVATFLEKHNRETNPFEAFLDGIYVTFPLKELKETGAILADIAGTSDITILRTNRTRSALRDSEIIFHLTGPVAVQQSREDLDFLEEFWRVSNRLVSLSVVLRFCPQ